MEELLSVADGGSMGISADRSVNYVCDGDGTAKNFAGISMAATALRSEKRVINNDWRKGIDKDYKKRKK